MANPFLANVGQGTRKITLLEWLLIAAIVVTLFLTLKQPLSWGASGTLRLPVRVVVTDAERQLPIEKANVLIFRDFAEPSPALRVGEFQETTDAQGAVVIEHEFDTAANHEQPIANARFHSQWVQVEADGYASVVVPISEKLPSVADLKKKGEVVVKVELALAKSLEPQLTHPIQIHPSYSRKRATVFGKPCRSSDAK